MEPSFAEDALAASPRAIRPDDTTSIPPIGQFIACGVVLLVLGGGMLATASIR